MRTTLNTMLASLIRDYERSTGEKVNIEIEDLTSEELMHTINSYLMYFGCITYSLTEINRYILILRSKEELSTI